ncbi:Protein disulfide-isomerase TMX3 [Oryzias melastigma]|nr:Protein disulfide-isomerase TMX3 [Oryzias melastigma]
MDGSDYINSLIMGEVKVPSVIILNTSNEQYFLPSEPIETMEQLVQFISDVLNGSAQAYGGDGFIQRIKRVVFDARSTIMSVFRSSPLLGCFLFGLPLGVISLMCYGICTAESDDGSDDIDALKREGLTDEEEEEEEERQRTAELEAPEEEDEEEEEEEEEEMEEEGEKNPEEKKTD